MYIHIRFQVWIGSELAFGYWIWSWFGTHEIQTRTLLNLEIKYISNPEILDSVKPKNRVGTQQFGLFCHP